MRHAGRDVWKQRVQRWAESGLTAKQFAAEVGCNAHTLTHWRWRFSEGAPSAPPAARSAEAPRFVEVVASADAPSEESETFELVLPRGLRVRIPPRFEAAALRALLTALEGR